MCNRYMRLKQTNAWHIFFSISVCFSFIPSIPLYIHHFYFNIFKHRIRFSCLMWPTTVRPKVVKIAPPLRKYAISNVDTCLIILKRANCHKSSQADLHNDFQRKEIPEENKVFQMCQTVTFIETKYQRDK